jgi:hypothetical protein
VRRPAPFVAQVVLVIALVGGVMAVVGAPMAIDMEADRRFVTELLLHDEEATLSDPRILIERGARGGRYIDSMTGSVEINGERHEVELRNPCTEVDCPEPQDTGWHDLPSEAGYERPIRVLVHADGERAMTIEEIDSLQHGGGGWHVGVGLSVVGVIWGSGWGLLAWRLYRGRAGARAPVPHELSDMSSAQVDVQREPRTGAGIFAAWACAVGLLVAAVMVVVALLGQIEQDEARRLWHTGTLSDSEEMMIDTVDPSSSLPFVEVLDHLEADPRIALTWVVIGATLMLACALPAVRTIARRPSRRSRQQRRVESAVVALGVTLVGAGVFMFCYTGQDVILARQLAADGASGYSDDVWVLVEQDADDRYVAEEISAMIPAAGASGNGVPARLPPGRTLDEQDETGWRFDIAPYSEPVAVRFDPDDPTRAIAEMDIERIASDGSLDTSLLLAAAGTVVVLLVPVYRLVRRPRPAPHDIPPDLSRPDL